MNQRLDIIGIGLGPSNLSLAALGSEIGVYGAIPGAQTSFLRSTRDDPGGLQHADQLLKDLVSAVAPTNRYSFLNYLVKRKFYRF